MFVFTCMIWYTGEVFSTHGYIYPFNRFRVNNVFQDEVLEFLDEHNITSYGKNVLRPVTAFNEAGFAGLYYYNNSILIALYRHNAFYRYFNFVLWKVNKLKGCDVWGF